MTDPIHTIDIDTWNAPSGRAGQAAELLEAGAVLHFPRLAFALEESQEALLTPDLADPGSKNVNYDPATGSLRGTTATGPQREGLERMVARFYQCSRQLVTSLLPEYTGALRPGLTSYRPFQVEGRQTSPTKDDTRVHVDAFASRPNGGLRILRVFNNISPRNEPRVWEVGEPFPALARQFHSRIPRQLPGSARVLHALGITKTVRTPYDHVMLNLHDGMKRDSDYQARVPKARIEFQAGSTWMCFSDSVSHAALRGQHLLEQTFYLPVSAMRDQAQAPLRVLEALHHRKLA